MSLKVLFSAASIAIAGVALASAQEDHPAHQMEGMAPASGAEAEYRAAMDRMHAAMSEMTYSGDADIDFARGMIPHHQAAIDMAKTVIANGSDAEIRELAKAIVDAQEREIVQLEGWLAAHGAAE